LPFHLPKGLAAKLTRRNSARRDDRRTAVDPYLDVLRFHDIVAQLSGFDHSQECGPVDRPAVGADEDPILRHVAAYLLRVVADHRGIPIAHDGEEFGLGS